MPVTFDLLDAAALAAIPNLVTDFNEVAAEWSRYLIGNVTINVNLAVGAFPANAGFFVQNSTMDFIQVEAAGGLPLVETYAQYLLTTGTHAVSGAPDIEVILGGALTVNDGLGAIYFNPDPSPAGGVAPGYDGVTLIRKGLAYALGIQTTLTTTATNPPGRTPLDRYVQTYSGGQFLDPNAITPPDVSGVLALTGPTAEAVYGGPVPLTTPASNYPEGFVHFGNTPTVTGGADILSVTQSLPNKSIPISSLDLAFLEDAGVAIKAQLFNVTASVDAMAEVANFAITRPATAAALTVYATTNTGLATDLAKTPVNFAPGQATATFAMSVSGANVSQAQTYNLSVSASPSTLSVLGTAAFTIANTGPIPCFARGTRITTARGEIRVEDLILGDMVPTANGARPLPIIWIGRRSIDIARHAAPEKIRPVRVRAGAFSEGQPARDLRLSPDHAVYLWEKLIPIRCLINDTTVTQEPVNTVTYFHIELPLHAIILAENLPVESYLDLGNRSAFENAGNPISLHPDFHARIWHETACAELILGGPVLTAARIRLKLQASWLEMAGRNTRRERK